MISPKGEIGRPAALIFASLSIQCASYTSKLRPKEAALDASTILSAMNVVK